MGGPEQISPSEFDYEEAENCWGSAFFYLWRVINVVDLWTIVVVRELLGQTQRLLFGVSFAKLKQSNSCERCPNFSAQPKLVFSLTNIKYETMGTGVTRGRRKTFCPSWSHPFRNYVSPSNYYDDLSKGKLFLARASLIFAPATNNVRMYPLQGINPLQTCTKNAVSLNSFRRYRRYQESEKIRGITDA